MATRKTLFMETTTVEVERTAAEVCSCLVQSGANQISTDYTDGKITGLRWVMKIHGQDIVFTMPARVEPVYKILIARRSDRHLQTTQLKVREQAHRVAWRQLLRWVQAQLAMIDCGMTQAAEVFFPYIQAAPNLTMFQLFEEQKFKMIEAPKDSQQ